MRWLIRRIWDGLAIIGAITLGAVYLSFRTEGRVA